MGFSSETIRVSAQTIRWRASHCCKRSLHPSFRHLNRPKTLPRQWRLYVGKHKPASQNKFVLYESGWSTLHIVRLEENPKNCKKQENIAYRLEENPKSREDWMPISLKLQEIAGYRHQKSTQEVEKPPYAKFQNCCRCCRMLQDVARWNISRKWSMRTVRLPPSKSASSTTPKMTKRHFFEILCNVADAPVLAIAAETRYSYPATAWAACTYHRLGVRILPPYYLIKWMVADRRARRHSKDLDETVQKCL